MTSLQYVSNVMALAQMETIPEVFLLLAFLHVRA